VLASVGAASVSPVLLGATRTSHHADAGQLPEVRTELAFEGRILTGPQQRSTDSPFRYAAAILGGEIAGPLLAGKVQSGRIEWSVDAASHIMQVTARYAVLRQDGGLVQVTDRSVHPQAIAPAAISRLQTAPEISAEGEHHGQGAYLLVGLLDASQFAAGQVTLRAFRVV
jgi:hypothetical protein